MSDWVVIYFMSGRGLTDGVELRRIRGAPVPAVGDCVEPWDGWASIPVEQVCHRIDARECWAFLQHDPSGEIIEEAQRRAAQEAPDAD